MRLSGHKGALFLSPSFFFFLPPRLFLVFFLSPFVLPLPPPPPHPCSEKGEPLRPGFSIQHLLIPPGPPHHHHPHPRYTIFILPHHVTQPNPPLSMPRPACVPRPCLSCSRFSFCWRVLIGLKWVTSSITQSFKPSLNVSVSWGSGGIVGLPPDAPAPPGSPPDRRRNPRPDGVAKVWPGGKSTGLCQHSLQCTQRPQDQSEHKRSS